MLKPLTLIAALFFLWPAALPAVAHAQDEACNPYADIPVSITPVFEDPHVNLETSIDGIQSLVRDGRHSIHESIAMGVTHYEPMLEIRLPVKTTTYPDGTSCAHVERADVTIGYKDVTIYIAREIPRDSCGFNEIMQHEKKHIAVNQAILDEYTSTIKEKLSDYLKLNGTFREQNAAYSTTLVREKMQSILNDLGEQMLVENRNRQQAVDSPEEYRRITVSCNGQLGTIAARSLGSHP